MKTYTLILSPVSPATEPTTMVIQNATCQNRGDAYVFYDNKQVIVATYKMSNVVTMTSIPVS